MPVRHTSGSWLVQENTVLIERAQHYTLLNAAPELLAGNEPLSTCCDGVGEVTKIPALWKVTVPWDPVESGGKPL